MHDQDAVERPASRQDAGLALVRSFSVLKFLFRLGPFFLRLGFRRTSRLLLSLIGEFLCNMLFCLSALLIVFFHVGFVPLVPSVP